MTMNITGADVRTPRATHRLLSNLAWGYGQFADNIELFRGRQLADGVSGVPIAALTAMFDRALIVKHVLEEGADRALQHARRIDDTIGANPALAGTQAGGSYTDPAAR